MCGAYLSVLDSDRRLADHFGGKVRVYAYAGFWSDHFFAQMHLGYHELRKMLEEFSKRKATISSARPASSMPPPEAPAAARSSERDYRRSDDGYRDRDRDRDHSRGSGYDRGHSSRNEYAQPNFCTTQRSH